MLEGSHRVFAGLGGFAERDGRRAPQLSQRKNKMYQKVIEQKDVAVSALEIPGVTMQILHQNDSSGGMTVLTHMAPGSVIPEHWHTSADETVFVLSGDFIEQDRSYGPGSFFVGKAGTSHGPHKSSGGCTVLTTFSAPLDFKMGRSHDPEDLTDAFRGGVNR
jgi:quercetin dioxygenase-like cupin family protein